MSVSSRHILRQGPVLQALGRTALLALKQRAGNGSAPAMPVLPGPEARRTAPPLPRRLIDDYLRHLGADPRAYAGELPPHLFPQWCMPVLARTLEGLPYPLLQVVNGGCRIEVRAPLPDAEPLEVRARLQSIDEGERRAVLEQRVVTGTARAPEALIIDFFAIVPLAPGRARALPGRVGGITKPLGPQPTARVAALPRSVQGRPDKARVSESAREISRMRLGRDAALSFAKLTGDFNPIHWLPAYARASGFGGVILHGFATLARAWEGLNRGVFGGDVHALTSFEVKLTRPLVLPHEVGLYVARDQVWVGDAPGGPAYLTGTFATAADQKAGDA